MCLFPLSSSLESQSPLLVDSGVLRSRYIHNDIILNLISAPNRFNFVAASRSSSFVVQDFDLMATSAVASSKAQNLSLCRRHVAAHATEQCTFPEYSGNLPSQASVHCHRALGENRHYHKLQKRTMKIGAKSLRAAIGQYGVLQRSLSNHWSPSQVWRTRPNVQSMVCAAASGDTWKEVLDPGSGKPYFWNTATNETSWQAPDGWKGDSEEGRSSVSSTSPLTEQDGFERCRYCTLSLASLWIPCGPRLKVLSNNSLIKKLLKVDVTRFGAECEPYRTRLFEDDAFGNHLNELIRDTNDHEYRERLEKLRARLANPLLKNPPPFDEDSVDVNF